MGDCGRLTDSNQSKNEWACCRNVIAPRLLGGPRRVVSLIVIGIFVVSSLAYYIPEASTAEDDQATLRIGMVQSIDSLNPFIGVNDNAYVFYGLVYDYLICLDENLQPKPNLAVSWSIVDEYEPYGSVWQYNLTHNARWHDGERVTADDVVFTFEYQIGEKWATMWAYQPYTLLVGSVEKVDDYTVRLFFEKDGEPVACSFGDSLMMPIVPEHYWSEIHYVDAGFSHTNPKPLGSGPFMCTDQTYSEFLRGDRLILYRHDDYHGAVEYGKEIQFERLILEFYLEPAALLADMQRGAIDVAQFDAPTYMSLLSWLEKNPSDSIHTHAGPKCTGYSVEIGVCMNPESAGTNHLRLDPAVRQAMAYATDKEFICDHIYRGLAEIGSTILSPVFPEWYWEPEPGEEYYFDIDKANEILDDAGYLWNDGHTARYAPADHPYNLGVNPQELRFELVVEQEIIEDRATAMFLVEEWAQVGIILDPIYVDTALWGTIVYGGVYDLCLTYWSGDPDPNYLLYVQSTDALDGWSENWYSSAEYDENYTASVLEIDPEARLEYVLNCQELMYRDAAFIVTAYPYECTAWRTDRFSGWGDWTAHPGRALSNFWTANDLYFDLVPVSDNVPPFVILDNVAGPVGESLEVTAYAEDPEGQGMTYLLEFGDGQNVTGSVPSDGEISAAHEFGSVGVYLMNITVTDDEIGTRQSTSAIVVGPDENSPPTNVRVRPSTIKGEAGSEVSFTVTGRDIDGDPVEFTLSYGDDSIDYSTSEDSTSEGFEFTVSHTFDSAGDFAVTLDADDSTHLVTVVLLYTVAEPEGGTSIATVAIAGGALVLLVAAAVLLLIRRRRRDRVEKEEEDVRLP